jgi:hypothetical protein
VIRFTHVSGQTVADGAPEKIAELPASDAALDEDTAKRLNIPLNQTRGYNHWTRNVIFNAAGRSSTSRSDRRPTRLRECRCGHRARGNPRVQTPMDLGTGSSRPA